MNIAVAQHPEDPQQPVQQVHIPVQSREQITAQQLSILVQSAMHLANALLPSPVDPDEKPLKSLTTEVEIAAEHTIIGICAQIDKIVADDKRWSLKKHASLEQQISRVYKAHIRSLAEQSIALRATQRMPIELLYIREAGEWVCIMASGPSRDQLIGRGKYPADAIADFDRKFSGVNLNTNEQENQQSGVVSTRDKHPAANAKKRRNRLKNRKGDGSQPEGGLSQD